MWQLIVAVAAIKFYFLKLNPASATATQFRG